MHDPARVAPSSRRVLSTVAALVLASTLLIAAPGLSGAATPSSGTIGPDATSVSWTGQTYELGTIADPATGGAGCPPEVDPANAVCDHFFLTVDAAPSYWDTNTGGARITIDWS